MRTIILDDEFPYRLVCETFIKCIPAEYNQYADEPVAYLRMRVDDRNDLIAPCHDWEELKEMANIMLWRLKPVIEEKLRIEKGADE